MEVTWIHIHVFEKKKDASSVNNHTKVWTLQTLLIINV